MMAGTLPTKRLQLLHDMIPVVTTIAMLVDSGSALKNASIWLRRSCLRTTTFSAVSIPWS